MKPGSPKKIDYHYKRNGTCSVFVAVEPLTGFRHIQVKKQRTKKEYFEFMKSLATKFPDVDKIIIICLVPKLCLGTHLHQKLCFERNGVSQNKFILKEDFGNKKINVCHSQLDWESREYMNKNLLVSRIRGNDRFIILNALCVSEQKSIFL